MALWRAYVCFAADAFLLAFQVFCHQQFGGRQGEFGNKFFSLSLKLHIPKIPDGIRKMFKGNFRCTLRRFPHIPLVNNNVPK